VRFEGIGADRVFDQNAGMPNCRVVAASEIRSRVSVAMPAMHQRLGYQIPPSTQLPPGRSEPAPQKLDSPVVLPRTRPPNAGTSNRSRHGIENRVCFTPSPRRARRRPAAPTRPASSSCAGSRGCARALRSIGAGCVFDHYAEIAQGRGAAAHISTQSSGWLHRWCRLVPRSTRAREWTQFHGMNPCPH
jgi:hypothetical protein